MRRLWKVLLGLLVVAPAAAYVAGSLATSSAEAPTPRPPIVIQAPAGTTPGSPDDQAPGGAPEHPVGEVQIDPDDLDDQHDDWGRDDEPREDHGDDHGQDGGGHGRGDDD